MSHRSPGSDRRAGLAFAALTAFLWGFLPIVMRVGLDQVDPYTLVAFRFGLAGALLAALSVGRHRARFRAFLRPRALVVVACIGLTVNYVLYSRGLELTSPATAQVVIQLAPPLLAAIGVFAFGERLRRRQLVGALLVALGLGLFFRDQLAAAAAAAEGTGEWRTGALCIFLAAVAWAVYAALQKGLAQRGMDPQEINLFVFVAGAILVAPWVDVSKIVHLDATGWSLLLYMGVNTLVAYGALAEALKRLPANQVSVIITLNPVLTLLALAGLEALGVRWIDPEQIGWSGYLGAALVVGGVLKVVRGAARDGTET